MSRVRLACLMLSLQALFLNSQSPTQAADLVVFGNLGADANGALGTTNTDIGTGSLVAANWLAQGFDTGSSTYLTIKSVTLGIFGSDSTTIPVSVSIYSASGNDPGTELYQSSVTPVGNTGLYNFAFSNAVLQPGTSYFILPDSGSWYYRGGPPGNPVAQYDSGYSYVSTRESYDTGASPAGPWFATDSRYAFAVFAVPEPSTILLTATGISLALLASKRKRRDND